MTEVCPVCGGRGTVAPGFYEVLIIQIVHTLGEKHAERVEGGE